ncbi:hypothetical protein MHYP_G00240240 [Metynnis hypsauchen]
MNSGPAGTAGCEREDQAPEQTAAADGAMYSGGLSQSLRLEKLKEKQPPTGWRRSKAAGQRRPGSTRLIQTLTGSLSKANQQGTAQRGRQRSLFESSSDQTREQNGNEARTMRQGKKSRKCGL